MGTPATVRDLGDDPHRTELDEPDVACIGQILSRGKRVGSGQVLQRGLFDKIGHGRHRGGCGDDPELRYAASPTRAGTDSAVAGTGCRAAIRARRATTMPNPNRNMALTGWRAAIAGEVARSVGRIVCTT